MIFPLVVRSTMFRWMNDVVHIVFHHTVGSSLQEAYDLSCNSWYPSAIRIQNLRGSGVPNEIYTHVTSITFTKWTSRLCYKWRTLVKANQASQIFAKISSDANSPGLMRLSRFEAWLAYLNTSLSVTDLDTDENIPIEVFRTTKETHFKHPFIVDQGD